jgi:hypothetical protein
MELTSPPRSARKPAADRAAHDILNADRAAISEVPVCSKPAQEPRLDSDREALAGIALRAFESAHIITGRGRFDLRWVDGMMLALDQAGAQNSQSPITTDKGRSSNQHAPLFPEPLAKIVRRRTARRGADTAVR